MSKTQTDSYCHEEQMKKIISFTHKQHDKASQLIQEAKEQMANLTPSEQGSEVKEQADALLKRVNNELDLAMVEVNRQMELLITQ